MEFTRTRDRQKTTLTKAGVGNDNLSAVMSKLPVLRQNLRPQATEELEAGLVKAVTSRVFAKTADAGCSEFTELATLLCSSGGVVSSTREQEWKNLCSEALRKTQAAKEKEVRSKVQAVCESFLLEQTEKECNGLLDCFATGVPLFDPKDPVSGRMQDATAKLAETLGHLMVTFPELAEALVTLCAKLMSTLWPHLQQGVLQDPRKDARMLGTEASEVFVKTQAFVMKETLTVENDPASHLLQQAVQLHKKCAVALEAGKEVPYNAELLHGWETILDLASTAIKQGISNQLAKFTRDLQSGMGEVEPLRHGMPDGTSWHGSLDESASFKVVVQHAEKTVVSKDRADFNKKLNGGFKKILQAQQQHTQHGSQVQ